MSSTLLSESPQRNWWPMSPKMSSSEFSSDRPSAKHPGKFNTFATPMGFKPKKAPPPPPLTIQAVHSGRSPLPRLVPRTEPSHRRPSTAPSNGMNRAPSNSVSSSRSRGDSIEPNTPTTPEDARQARRGSLLTLSDTDPFAARVVSLSPNDPNRLSAFSNNSSGNDSKSHEIANRVSYASTSSHSFRLGGDLSPLSAISSPESGYMNLSNKKSTNSLRRKDVSGSDGTWLSNLGVEPNRYSQPDLPKPRPMLRARGMTDASIDRPFGRQNSFNSSHASSSSPFLSTTTPPPRKSALSQPSAPPTHDLPPPPLSPADSMDLGSSTSMTFSTTISQKVRAPRQMSPKSPDYYYGGDMRSGIEPEMSPRTHRTLRKSLSQQSMGKLRQSSSSNISAPPPEPAVAKAPRKQRSFHQHRAIPPVPLSLPLSEQRANEPRKRLFSNSRRPSQSTLAMDDARSLTSLTDLEPMSSANSYWIDTEPPRSPVVSVHEYTPQQIMSPAEMFKIDTSVDDAYRCRPRGESVVSELDLGCSPVSRPRSNSERPSPIPDLYMPPSPPSPPILTSLPPPPRRKSSNSRTSSISHTSSTASTRSPPQVAILPLSPARKNVRPKISVEERLHRQAPLRKPSFLDIDDEIERAPPPPPPMARQDSFLDLTRDSMDYSRSDDDSS
ncbi:unnamed protein product [Mycena citricolor]|uniref:Uncharacterized protein n=1 Tax=Mycena citricolor TaxID=2018698 RepID=A0AAD2HQT4_9AGAR|nr:unnamed protein product [Mycena citricolor]